MGNCNFNVDPIEEGQCKSHLESTIFLAINKTHFKFHNVIGKGGFGKVWKLERKKFKTTYALKEMSKCRIVQKKSVNSIMNERKLLS